MAGVDGESGVVCNIPGALVTTSDRAASTRGSGHLAHGHVVWQIGQWYARSMAAPEWRTACSLVVAGGGGRALTIIRGSIAGSMRQDCLRQEEQLRAPLDRIRSIIYASRRPCGVCCPRSPAPPSIAYSVIALQTRRPLLLVLLLRRAYSVSVLLLHRLRLR